MKRFINIVCMGLMLASGVTVAADKHMHTHKHATVESLAQRCADTSRVPSIDCARAPSATFDAKGDVWVAWAFAGHVYVSHSTDKGRSFGTPVAVNRIPEPVSARGENRTKVVVDKAGRIFVSWTTPLQKRFTGHIRFSRSLDGGRSFAEPITVNDNLEITSHRFDAMGLNAKGDLYIAWLDKRDRLRAEREGKPYRGAAIYYALSSNHGESFNKNKKILDNTCECCRVAMAIDTDQLPVVIWRNIYGENTRDHALVKFIATDTPGDAVRVSYDEWQVDACPHHGPAIDVDSEGRYHAVWFNNAPQRHGLFYAHSEDQGKSFPNPLSFGDYERTASHPDVLSANDRVYLAWREFDGKVHNIRLMSAPVGTDNWTAARTVATSSGDADYPFLLHHDKEIYLAWRTESEGFRISRMEDVHS